MNDIIKIIKSIEDSNILVDVITKTVKTETKNKKDGFIPALLVIPLAASLVQTVTSSVVKGISRRGTRKPEEDIFKKIFSSIPSFKQYWNY